MLRTIRVDFGPITKPRDASLKIFRKYRKDFNTVYICSWQHQKKNTDQLCHATYQHKQFLIFSFQFMITTKKSPNKKLNNTFTCFGDDISATGRTRSTILSCNLRQNKHIYPLVSVLDPLTQKKTNLQ